MLLALSLSALPVFADSLQLTGTGGNNSGGVYTYPYDFTINSTPNVQLMCDSFLNEVYIGEKWTANVYSITSAGTLGDGLYASESLTLGGNTYSSQQVYDAAGLLYLAALGKGPLDLDNTPGISTLSTGLANWAIWNLFDPKLSDPPSPFSINSVLDPLDIAALNDVGTYSGLLANVVVYAPVPGSQIPGTDGTPQEYIGVVPEPSSLLLMGSGLMGLAGFARRRFLK